MKTTINKKYKWMTFDKIEIGDVFKSPTGSYYIKSTDGNAIDLYKKHNVIVCQDAQVKRLDAELIIDDN